MNKNETIKKVWSILGFISGWCALGLFIVSLYWCYTM